MQIDNKAVVLSEQQVIGGFMLHPEQISKYSGRLSPGDFYYKPYADIYGKLVEASKSGKIFDEIIFSSFLTNSEEKQVAFDCADKVTAVSLLPEHIKLVLSESKSRRIKQGIDEIMCSGNYTIEALQSIIDCEQVEDSPVEFTSAEAFDDFVNGLNKPRPVLKTGFAELDYALGGGIRRGTLAVIGARPSTGKTTFAINIARNQIANKRKVYFFSLEMTASMILERFSADVCGINLRNFTTNTLTPKELAAVKGLAEDNKKSKNFVVVDNQYTVESITADIYANKPDVVIIDYIQRLRSTNESRFNDERTKINYFTSELKIAAKRTGTSVIVLSQVVRSGKDSPTMSDLKESGALEEDGDYVMLLHRPYIADKETTEYKPSETELNLDKNKFGSTRLIDLNFDLAHQRFTESYNGIVKPRN